MKSAVTVAAAATAQDLKRYRVEFQDPVRARDRRLDVGSREILGTHLRAGEFARKRKACKMSGGVDGANCQVTYLNAAVLCRKVVAELRVRIEKARIRKRYARDVGSRRARVWLCALAR